ncbi:hypothetical protein Q9Q95_03305 [Sphingomonas sp. DG1-23]|uniref:hypothetical protein n=1 Tax=Sphingomonas sp. DG1-23 TaxID=3068316 RepID=UPI00273E67C9|nr:hypothetical protein [Sphingomonas sp. DG1-23]MDP5277939.1 hypothetical protein [Sphingomonas sp. DG1-23]
MVRISLGRFDIDTQCEQGGAAVANLTVGNAGQHKVTFRNRTTLPYDVRATCMFPDPNPPRGLSYNSATPSQDVIGVASLTGSASAVAGQALDVHGPAGQHQRLQITVVEYRLTTAGVGLNMGSLWKAIATSALPFTDTVDVV